MPTPSLYIIVDRTWYSVDQAVPQGGAISAGSIFAAGLKQFAEEQSGAPLALLFEPIRVNTPNGVRNSGKAADYAVPAVAFTTEADPIAKSLAAQPATVGTLVVSTDLIAASAGAMQYIETEKPERYGVVLLLNVMDSSSSAALQAFTNAKVPYLLLSEHGQADPALRGLTTWVASADDVAVALHKFIGVLGV
jgi:hypothetical protein